MSAEEGKTYLASVLDRILWPGDPDPDLLTNK
jgi:hypothetical protein